MNPRTTSRWLACLCAVLALTSACYTGAEEEGKEPPPGYPGGWCLETLSCVEAAWVCDKDGLYCYNFEDPCDGVHCGWHGTCSVDIDAHLPVCTCDPGYSNEDYALYCAGPDGASGGASF